MSSDQLAQKNAGIKLLGTVVRFAHELDGQSYRVIAVGWNGMVTLEGMDGEYAPHLFFVSRSG